MGHKKKFGITSDEQGLFRDAMQMPLPSRLSTSSPLQTPPNRPHVALPQDSLVILNAIHPDGWYSGEQIIQFASNGISYLLQRKLKRGQLPIEAQLDLHGNTGNEALEKAAFFLENAALQQKRCVLVIHGKGSTPRYPGPVLKNLLNHWLRQQPLVLAAHSACPKDGGTGALYILLAKTS